MAYNFKSIADVEVVAEPADTANVLIEENGVIKKAPKTAVGGGTKVITYRWEADGDEYYYLTLDGVEVRASDVKAEWDAGSVLRIEYGSNSCSMVVGIDVNITSDGNWIDLLYISEGGINRASAGY